MKNRFFVFPLVVAAGIFLIVACGGKPFMGFTNRTTIKCVFMASPAQVKIYNEVISAFKKKYPQYKVVPVYYNDINYEQKVADFFLGNEEPDFIQINNFYNHARQGDLMDLSMLIAQDSAMAWENFFPATKQMVEYQRKIFGFPISLDTEVFYVNKEKFKQSGIKIPYAGWTMKQFIKAARAMTKIKEIDITNAQYGFGFEPQYKIFVPYLWSVGADTINKDGNFTFRNPRINDIFQMFVDLRLRDQTMAPLKLMLTTDLVDPFFNGKICMVSYGRPFVLDMVASSKIDWDVVPLPAIGDVSALIEGRICAIPVNARNKAGAWQLLHFIVLEEGAQILLSSGDSIPPLMSLAHSASFSNWGGGSIHNDVFLRQLAYGKVDKLQQHQQGSDMMQNINTRIWSMFLGQTNVTAQLDMIESIISAGRTNLVFEE